MSDEIFRPVAVVKISVVVVKGLFEEEKNHSVEVNVVEESNGQICYRATRERADELLYSG
jgi:hypothetical protein